MSYLPYNDNCRPDFCADIGKESKYKVGDTIDGRTVTEVLAFCRRKTYRYTLDDGSHVLGE